MTDFRPGDRTVTIKGEAYTLRLSVSAFAAMADAFKTEGPKDLAKRLRRANVADWNRILQLMTTPLPPDLDHNEMAKILPDISAVIHEGLRA
jgi:hypothetical protein